MTTAGTPSYIPPIPRLPVAAALVAALAGLELVTSPIVGAAPPPPPGNPLGPPIAIPAPAVGHAGFAQLTVSGVLASGVTQPTVSVILGQSPSTLPPDLRAAIAPLKRVIVNGRATLTYAIVMNNFRPTRRLAGGSVGGDAMNLIVAGAAAEWDGSPPTAGETEESCSWIKHKAAGAFIRGTVLVGNSTPQQIVTRAIAVAEKHGCK